MYLSVFPFCVVFLYIIFLNPILSKKVYLNNNILYIYSLKKIGLPKLRKRSYSISVHSNNNNNNNNNSNYNNYNNNNNENYVQNGDEENLRITNFEKEDIKINKHLNVNIFRTEKNTSIYDEGLCIYNILKDIEIKDVKKVPCFDPNLADITIEHGNNNNNNNNSSDNNVGRNKNESGDHIYRLRQNKKSSYLENSLIYKDTNYELPYVLNYYPDDMFIFNFDGVINLNKQEKIVVAFLTFLKIFKQPFVFNNKKINNLMLYDFIEKDANHIFQDNDQKDQKNDSSKLSNNNNVNTYNEWDGGKDPFILHKLMPKFFYTRLLHIYKYLKRNEDLVIAIKYIYDEINNVCIKYNYNINDLIALSNEKNVLAKKLNEIKNSKSVTYENEEYDNNIKINKNINKENINNNNNNNCDHINNYELTKELTMGTFNPNILYKYKNIENLFNIFPCFRAEFEDFYINNIYLKLYEKYKLDSKYVHNEFNKIRNNLMSTYKNAYLNLIKYRYICNDLNDEERKKHETFNFTCIDIINHNINIFKKPIYIMSTTENYDFIKYTLNVFGLHIERQENHNLLRIFGYDTLYPSDSNHSNKYNKIITQLRNLFKTDYFNKQHKQNEKDDYIYDKYNIDINYLNYFNKTQKKDYYFKNNLNYMNILKEKCDIINIIIKSFHDDNNSMIHIVDHKYDDLNALSNDSRIHKKIKLYFCEWGYNTYEEKQKAIFHDKIKTFQMSYKLIFLACTLQNSPRRKHTHGKGLETDFYSKFMHKYCLQNGLLSKVDMYNEPIQD
ncbi:conserved Plasmodium protein, unknown function [Plasmodium gaboni]|uniref:Uncharacterized protein n=1 Tax=Plasmodium gaboni TaxID=647221 RepID=A0ABY1UL91_9APIC|nr:conserved Plasmodium protein, unknown function [Plasmodium gaboni]